MSAAYLKIEGMSDCMRWCDKAPEDMVKLAKKAMRDGGKAVTKRMRLKIDARWRALLKYKVTGGKNDKDLNCGIGMFNNQKHQSHDNRKNPPSDWFKFYWGNYGTITKRDPKHHFEKPVKNEIVYRGRRKEFAEKRRRNNIGQQYNNWFEEALLGYEEEFFEAFDKVISENIEFCYDR